MQNFVLINDESEQGWHTTYLAFQIAARLGASLQVLMLESAPQEELEAPRASRVEVGGRAAGVTIATHFIKDFSIHTIARHAVDCDGLFVPRNLVSDEETAYQFLAALTYPLWIISRETRARSLGVLVRDWGTDKALLPFAGSLARRLQWPLLGLIPSEKFSGTATEEMDLLWVQLPNLNASALQATLARHNVDLLLLSTSEVSLVSQLNTSCILNPAV